MDDQNKNNGGSGTPYYYSYGPFRSSEPAGDANGTGEEKTVHERTATDVYAPVKKETWSYPVKTRRKSSLKSMFASFLAGAVVVASLMFAADKTNLFTGGDVVQQNRDTGWTSNSHVSSVNSDVRNAALQSGVRPDNIADIVAMASPAVVKIETYRTASSGGSIFDQFFGDDFFFGIPRQPERGEGDRSVPSGMGSGFFFDKEGYILTNQHVVSNASKVMVTVLGYAKPFEAEVLGTDADLDLAVLKIKGDDDFPVLEFGNTDELLVGDWVVAIGNPYGFDHTVTAGVLSAKEREIPIRDNNGVTKVYKHLFQTDASINPGNSGGPLLNLQGRVIGINTAVSAQAQGIGFAIPAHVILEVLDNLKNNVPVPKPYIGIYMSDLSEAGLEKLGLKNGVVITGVVENSPAASAGLRPYDVIVEMDGKKVTSSKEVQEWIGKKKVGDRVMLKIFRDDQMIQTGVIIGDRNK